MKKLIFTTLITLKTILTYSAMDTATNWQIYINQKMVHAGDAIFWEQNFSKREYETIHAPVEIHDIDLYKDSLGLTFFCHYQLDMNGYFFLKDENDKLVCIVPKEANLIIKKDGGRVTQPNYGVVYVPLWKVFLNYTKKDDPRTLRVYYLNPLDNDNFKDGKERLIAVLKMFPLNF